MSYEHTVEQVHPVLGRNSSVEGEVLVYGFLVEIISLSDLTAN